jgi:sigma-B regulation protein RsbU (phosphoserine phosphatase)
VVLFTDGMSEAMNATGEEWGECRLIEILIDAINRCPAEIVQELFRAADTFTAGTPQHDDMTVVAVRII